MASDGRHSVECAERLLAQAAQILYESADDHGGDEDRELALNLTWSALERVRRSRQFHRTSVSGRPRTPGVWRAN